MCRAWQTSVSVRPDTLAPAPQTHTEYSYPTLEHPIDGEGSTPVTIDLQKPANHAHDPLKRLEYMAALRHYFSGPSGDPILRGLPKEQLPRLLPRFFQVPVGAIEGVPPRLQVVPGFRQFTVVAYLDRYAFCGPYHLELFLKGEKKGNATLQRISVLTRKDPFKCPACVGRIELGSRSRGIMTLDSRVVSYLLDREGKNNVQTSDEDVLQTIASNLGARLVSPGYTLFADTIPAEGAELLAPELIPQMSLFSAYAARHADRPALGLSFYRATEHEQLPYNPKDNTSRGNWYVKSGPVQ
jgi:hypothetical protein